YTRGLLAARPSMQPRINGQPQRLQTIAGTVPELVDLPAGCTFAGRCSFTQPGCFTQVPPAVDLASGHVHQVHCLRPEAYAASAAKNGAIA
ncbi:MAG: ABC transporter ATP-binding protein, partial [Comamonas sp.]